MKRASLWISILHGWFACFLRCVVISAASGNFGSFPRGELPVEQEPSLGEQSVLVVGNGTYFEGIAE